MGLYWHPEHEHEPRTDPLAAWQPAITIACAVLAGVLIVLVGAIVLTR